MSAAFIIPFNFDPTNTVVGTSGPYTVPSGYYALVKINFSLAVAKLDFTNTNWTALAVHNFGAESVNDQIDLWLPAGTILNISSVDTTGAVNFGGGSGATNYSLLGSSILSIALTGTITSTIEKRAYGSANLTFNSASNTTIGFSVVSSFDFIVSEYAKIS